MNTTANRRRRDFFKISAAASAGVAMGTAGTDSPQASAKPAPRPATDTAGKVEVNHEWGALKEVVCGIPHFAIPTSLPKAVYNYAPAEGIRLMEAHPGKTLEEADPATYKRAYDQMEGAVRILQERGITVHRPKPATQVEQDYLDNIFPSSVIQFFPRDPMLVIGNRYIETELMFPTRRRERFGLRRAIGERLDNSNAEVVSMPPAVPSPQGEDGSWGPGPFIEGGDVFLLGRDIYVGVSGNASNRAGVQWLDQYLGDDYRVQEIELKSKFLHLDCCLATPRPGLAIICREAFANGLPSFLDGWELIDVSYADAKEKLACNGLVIDEKTIMISSGLADLAKSLRKAGQEVIETPFDAVYQNAGAFRCWHHPLVRESSLS